MEWIVSISCESLEDRFVRLNAKFDTFADVLNYLDMLNDYYVMKSVLIRRFPNDLEVSDEL